MPVRGSLCAVFSLGLPWAAASWVTAPVPPLRCRWGHDSVFLRLLPRLLVSWVQCVHTQICWPVKAATLWRGSGVSPLRILLREGGVPRLLYHSDFCWFRFCVQSRGFLWSVRRGHQLLPPLPLLRSRLVVWM